MTSPRKRLPRLDKYEKWIDRFSKNKPRLLHFSRKNSFLGPIPGHDANRAGEGNKKGPRWSVERRRSCSCREQVQWYLSMTLSWRESLYLLILRYETVCESNLDFPPCPTKSCNRILRLFARSQKYFWKSSQNFVFELAAVSNSYLCCRFRKSQTKSHFCSR